MHLVKKFPAGVSPCATKARERSDSRVRGNPAKRVRIARLFTSRWLQLGVFRIGTTDAKS